MVVGSPAVLDESALTGESRLVTREDGDPVSSGTVNAGSSFDLRATATAVDSAYAGIVRLVKEAQHSKAPFVRLADRYALIFVPFTLAIAAAAWLVSGDPVRGPGRPGRGDAVPAPARRADRDRRWDLARGAARRDRQGRRSARDPGAGPRHPVRQDRDAHRRPAEVGHDRRWSGHGARRHRSRRGPPARGLGRAAVAARARRLDRPRRAGTRPRAVDADDVVETPGAGVTGVVDGRRVAVGTADFCAGEGGLPRWARDVRRRAAIEGSTCAFVRVDDAVRGALVLDDPLRPETPRAIRSLRRIGFTRIVMVTGDNAAVADIIGSAIGVDAVLADRVPSEKVDAVHAERSVASGPIVMVGDGLNDAPALALADVGVAMGARGASASSEAADIVITVDRLDRLTEAVQIARRARSIAVQSVVLGMGMSIVAMAAAALGFLPVVAGAILQEAIDVVVILNALRALRGGVEVPVRIPGWTETSARLRAAHIELEPSIARIRGHGRCPRRHVCGGRGGRPRGGPSVRLGGSAAARGAGGPDDLPDARQRDGLRRRDRVDAPDPPGDLPTRAAARSPGPRPPDGGPERR